MSRLVLVADDGPVPLDSPGAGELIALVADPELVLHRVRLSGRSARARLAEARALAATLTTARPEALHVALGPADPDGAAWLALGDADRLRQRLAQLDAAGLVPTRLVPAALLLPPPADERPRAARLGSHLLVRGPDYAGAVEPELAAALGADPAAPALAPDPAAAGDAPDLRQGALAPARGLTEARWLKPLLALLALSALLLALVPAIAGKVREAAEARAADAAVVALARAALGRDVPEDAAAALAALERAAAKAPPLPVVAPALASAAAAVEAVPDAGFGRVSFSPSAGLEIALTGPAPAVNAVARRLEAGPFLVRQAGDSLRIGARRAAAPADQPAMQRLAEARAAAERLALARGATPGPAPARLGAALASVGLVAPVERPAAGGAAVRLEAVRPALALPLVARVEAGGSRVTRLELAPNSDPSLALALEIAP